MAGFGKVFVDGKGLGHPGFAGAHFHFVDAVGGGFIGAEDAEVFAVEIGLHDGVKQVAEDARGLAVGLAGAFDFQGEIAEVGNCERLQQQAAVGVGIHAHALAAFWSDVGEIGEELSLFVEELGRLVALHPLCKLVQVLGVGANFVERNLVGAPGAFDGLAIDEFGTGPALGCAHD